LRPLSLFISMTADGKVARLDGRTDWILTDQDYGFNSFFETVDTLVMGRKTFEKCLSLGPWPYEDKKTFVASSTLKNDFGSSVEIFNRDPCIFIEELKDAKGGKIWLVGGVQLARTLMEENLIDEVILNIHKEMLGEGIELFPLPIHSMFWTLDDNQVFPSGLIQARYKLKV
jgi:dihydrofolate reductase